MEIQNLAIIFATIFISSYIVFGCGYICIIEDILQLGYHQVRLLFHLFFYSKAELY